MDDRVFISYSNVDVAIANAVCAAIEGRGRRCWIAPRDIRPSGEWAEQIIDGINAANVMVMVFSESSNKSPQVRREVERAINREMPVIPFRIDRVLPTKSLEYFLSTQHWFDAFDGPIEAHIERLCLLLEAMRTGAYDHEAIHAPISSSIPPSTKTDLGLGSTARPTPPRVAAPPVLSEEDLAFIARELALHIGPIARYLAQRASAVSVSPSALVETLAAELEQPKERAAFTAACRQRLGLGLSL